MEINTVVYILTFLLIVSIIFNCYLVMKMKNSKNKVEKREFQIMEDSKSNKLNEDKITENVLIKISDSIDKVLYELDEDYKDELCYELKRDFNVKLEFLKNVPYDEKLMKKFIPQEKVNNGELVYSINPAWIRNGKVIKRGKIEKR